MVALIDVDLDKRRHLLPDSDALARFKRVAGVNLWQLEGNLSLDQVRMFFWACLVHEDRELTLETVGGMIHLDNIKAITAAVHKAYMTAMPEMTRAIESKTREIEAMRDSLPIMNRRIRRAMAKALRRR